MTRRCCARRMLRRLVLKLRFSYGFRGLFGSCPVLSAGPLYSLLSTLLATLLAVHGFSHFWPIALEFCLPAGPHRMEQSWPTRHSGAAQQSRHLAAQVGVLPTHRRVGCGSVLGCGDHIVALVAKDLEGFVEDRTQLGKDWATTNPAAFVMLDLWLWNAHPVQLPIDVVPSQR